VVALSIAVREICTRKLREIDYLLESPDDRGALGFGLNRVPPATPHKFNQTIDLKGLLEISEALVRGEISSDPDAGQIQDLLMLGTAMGRATPEGCRRGWQGALDCDVVAARRPLEPTSRARLLELARQCGIHAAESRIVTVAGKDVLLIRRFDRQGTSTDYTPCA
jgi:serine/threonine-protein kinase HipA